MDIQQLYRDYNIPFVTESHKHAREGWVNTPCPFCTGNYGYHLGYDSNDDKFVCWRCGGKNKLKALMGLLRVNYYDANQILKKYGVISGVKRKAKKKLKRKALISPPNIPLLRSHKNYLERRAFNPLYIEETYQITGTGVISRLDHISYKHRLVIPYIWDGKMVSWDTRDITDRAMNKYMACPEDREETPRKSILYGVQKDWGDTGIIVEGATDVWRLGTKSAATSGIKYTPKQVRLIAKTFKRVFIWYDPEPQAREQALKLAGDLKFRGCEAVVLDYEEPGGMEQKEADYVVNQLLTKYY